MGRAGLTCFSVGTPIFGGRSAAGKSGSGCRRNAKIFHLSVEVLFVGFISDLIGISGFPHPHVLFVDGALSKISQAELNRLGNVQAGHVQAIAVRLEVVKNRAGLFAAALNRCPCSEARHDRKSFSILVK